MIRIAMTNGWKRPRGSFQVADRSLRKQAICSPFGQIGDRYD